MTIRMAMVLALAVVAAPGWATAETRTLAEIKAGKRVADVVPAAADTNTLAGAGAHDANANVPTGWLKGVGSSGYEKARALQDESGWDLLVLFFRESPNDEKGLLRWFEKKGLNNGHVLKAMRGYVKVRVDAGQNDPRTRALLEEYHIEKTPRLVVRQPNGHTRRVDVFDWPGGQPDLASHAEIVERLKAASSPSYQAEVE